MRMAGTQQSKSALLCTASSLNRRAIAKWPRYHSEVCWIVLPMSILIWNSFRKYRERRRKGSVVFLVNIFLMYEAFQPRKHLKCNPLWDLNVFWDKVILNHIRKVQNQYKYSFELPTYSELLSNCARQMFLEWALIQGIAKCIGFSFIKTCCHAVIVWRKLTIKKSN